MATVEKHLFSQLTTQDVSQQATMPNCRYEILRGGANGEPVKFANVGEMVYHLWTCELDQKDTYCMKVHSCVIDDGSNSTPFPAIDPQG